MDSIQILDLQEIGHDHQQQRRRIRRWMDFLGLQDSEKIMVYLNSFSSGPPTRSRYINAYTHTHT